MGQKPPRTVCDSLSLIIDNVNPFLFFILFGVISCQSRPVKELALADLALKSAQKAKADSLSEETYRKAENYYLRAKKDYAEGYFGSSGKFAEQARAFAEKAEFIALYKQGKARGKDPEKNAIPFDSAPYSDDQDTSP
jgi:hypothetical protein